MDRIFGSLLYEIERVDLEFAVVHTLETQLKEAGKVDAAEYVHAAATDLQKAEIALRAAYKALDMNEFEQIKMDFLD